MPTHDTLRALLPGALKDLQQLVAIPSVAAQPGAPMIEASEATAALLRMRGLEAHLVPTTENAPPVVFAEDRRAGPNAPTVLFYNHYDVQPAEPLELWDSNPWQLRVDGDFVFGRGVSDDKGHILCRLMAIDLLRSQNSGALPVNVKFVIEGEEEVASVHLPDWVERHASILRADVCMWEFGGVDETGRPEIICGLRGIAYFELHSNTILYDAHSGVGGTVLPNAAWRLVWALSTLKSADERILLPGHYDAVAAPSENDLHLLAALPADTERQMRAEYQFDTFLGDATGTEFRRRAVFEPSCTVCGIESGYTGAGAKTVLPARAMAKVDFRLVPDQDPETVRDALRAHLDAHGFSDIEVVYLGGQKPARVDPMHPLVQLAVRTAREAYEKEPVIYPLVGGSGPMHPFAVGLGQPVVTCGVGYPGARVHAPNENLRVSDLVRGAAHTAGFLTALAAGAYTAGARIAGER